MTTKKRVRLLLCTVILVTIFFFMGRYFYENWQQVPFQKLSFNYLFLIISYFIYACAFILGGFIWKVNLSCIGENLSFMKSLRVTALTYLPRYVPGKVWGMVSQVWLTKKEGGITGERGGVCVVLGTVIGMLSGLLLFFLILPFTLKNTFSKNFYPMFALIPLFFIILHPSIFIRVVNFGLRKLKRKKIKFVLRYSQILKLLLLYTFSWILQCIGMYFFIRSFYSIDTSFFIPLCGIYPAAWVIGFMSFITPGGLGVREGILSYLFSFYMPVSVGIIASILIRIWATIGEVAFFAIFARGIKKYI